ncbi:unnamed protein product, partial [Oppiella nova]
MNSLEMNTHYLNPHQMNDISKARSDSERSIGALNLSVRNIPKVNLKLDKLSFNGRADTTATTPTVTTTVTEPADPPHSPSPPNYYDVNRIVIERSRKRAEIMELLCVFDARVSRAVVWLRHLPYHRHNSRVCFPMAEVISHRIPIGWYEGFYLYLYMGSILFLIFVYLFLLHRHHNKPMGRLQRFLQRMLPKRYHSAAQESDSENGAKTSDSGSDEYALEGLPAGQCGSFYLRAGAVAFGIGSMIYSGLEFAQFFELESKEHCYNFLYGFTPGSHVAFTFIQLYFIFMNSRVLIGKHKLIARFGLMHMIATNICVWLHVLIQETKHQIMIIVNPNTTELFQMTDFSIAWEHVDDVVEEISEDYLESIGPSYPSGLQANHQLVKRSLADHSIHTTHGECRRSNVIGDLVRDASQFLFPCTIEYSLICAAILYIMWKDVEDRHNSQQRHSMSSTTVVHTIHHKHHYQVDCAKAHKGLFTGIFLLVISIISLILFFVFIKKPQFRHLAVLQAHIIELFIYCINAIACLIALFQVRQLPYNRHRNVELDNILLIVAQIGLYIFTMFSIIGAQFFTLQQNTRLVMINALACLIQATLQTIFILDASHRFAATSEQYNRFAATSEQMRRKPGREMVTFLLVCNFAMWSINTLETRRADSNPVQMHFYGFWAWTIITHVTMPLTIFYRFHSTVCLCDIWKRTYKTKS